MEPRSLGDRRKLLEGPSRFCCTRTLSAGARGGTRVSTVPKFPRARATSMPRAPELGTLAPEAAVSDRGLARSVQSGLWSRGAGTRLPPFRRRKKRFQIFDFRCPRPCAAGLSSAAIDVTGLESRRKTHLAPMPCRICKKTHAECRSSRQGSWRRWLAEQRVDEWPLVPVPSRPVLKR